MIEDRALALHEKLYFHELDSREKLTARLQLSAAILTAFVGGLVYILYRLGVNIHPTPFAHAVFVISYVAAVALIAGASWYFVRALWNHSYECLPMATELEKYRTLLGATYQGFPDGDATATSHWEAFLVRYFSECAATNAAVNSTRYECLHKSTSFIVFAIPAAVIATLAFIFGGLAASPTP